MADETQTTGTPEPDGGDAAATQTTGTQATDGRDAQAPDDITKLNLEWKAKAERLNAVEAELAEIKERSQQSPAAGSDERSDKIDNLLEQAEAFAARGDAVAALGLRERAERLQFQQDVVDAYQLRDIDDKSERKEVAAHYQKNRHRLGDVNAATAEVREKKQAEQIAKLREQLKRAEASRPDPDVVRTAVREVPASEHQARKMTGVQFDQQQAALKAQGRFKEAMAIQRELDDDKIELTD